MLLSLLSFAVSICYPVHYGIVSLKDEQVDFIVPLLKYFFVLSILWLIEYLFSFLLDK